MCLISGPQNISCYCRKGPATAAAATATLPPRTETYARGNRVVHLTMVNIVAAPATPGPLLPGPPPPPAGTPRAQWDQPAPRERATDEKLYEFANPPPDAWFAQLMGNAPAILSDIPSWTGLQPLSGRERRWIAQPVLRSIALVVRGFLQIACVDMPSRSRQRPRRRQ
ncbi:uncharacterized protein BP01DRAFT_383562 [Aspergillus saccharolyticus JOP 1030-1]|uniref:Uncharacterized protein n=1 Tax=Aspergillus saccharolyticus JOP 1030-1 TaxID=1450539 RepID=A0A319ABS9_9EURO|nr:hypothetical protein BP01DRAFT_383562 [Aspergillus saccharolyticus JOP 1030-1]PYH44372.1 hypothetical protein BP01DRAFT_383562 [Aspergillus saccharolyticus JOP 1030-1]